MLPPELVEQIIDHAWGCLTTSSHRHGYSMTQWMLVSRDWLEIVLSVVFRNLWITSNAHINYIIDCGNTQKSFIFELAGIPGPEIYRHISQTCRSLIISVYYSFDGQYASQCEQLIEYATSDSQEDFHPGLNRYKQKYTIPVERICQAISDFTPHISSLHFVLIDCTATYGGWDMYSLISSILPMWYPFSLTELHISFAYTSPHPALLLDAPRGTFFPPRSHSDLPRSCCFEGVRRLVIRDANSRFRRVHDGRLPVAEARRVDGGVQCSGRPVGRARVRPGPAGICAPPPYGNVSRRDDQGYDALSIRRVQTEDFRRMAKTFGTRLVHPLSAFS
ncbi:hypothetical protein B0H16DRAFT_731028 [Mycena metata]|uniref:Uncharacterized protein n=1 Tax=Mycena metata TaxID=1033252 RepID=A0AAD7NCK1_9AGAR|nr:hypothetical protein B0H16DRAFT_731028 [Mycena metata]